MPLSIDVHRILNRLPVSDHEERLRPRQDAPQNALQRFRVERREALVEPAQIEPLKQRPRAE